MGSIRASAQYTDIRGTAAADLNPSFSLTQFAKQHGVDTDRYDVIGIGFYRGELSPAPAQPEVTLHLRDKQDPQPMGPADRPRLLRARPEVTLDEYLALFHRLEVVLVRGEYADIEEYDDVIDLSPNWLLPTQRVPHSRNLAKLQIRLVPPD